MTGERESVEVTLARIEERVASIDRRLDDRGRDEAEIRKEIAAVLEAANRAATAVRLDLERQIQSLAADFDQHQAAVNPHSAQEAWLRGGMKDLMDKLDAIKDEIATGRGSGRVWSLLGAAAVTSVITFAVTRALGG